MMKKRYGKSNRIWVMDRGMTSEDNLEFLRQENRRYIIGTNKALLKKFEQELLKKDWTTIRDGIEVKRCKMPKEERVRAHIFVCFLSFVLWKTLGQQCKRAGLMLECGEREMCPERFQAHAKWESQIPLCFPAFFHLMESRSNESRSRNQR